MATDQLFLEPNIGKPTEKVGYFATREAFDRFADAYLDGMDTLPEPHETAAVPTAFGPVRAYRFGDRAGTPVVLLSGRQASTPMWRTNLPGLVADHTVWSLDSIGEPGASSQHRPLTGAADQAAWVSEALAGLGIARAHLLGVSIGGWLATQVAIHRPERVASVTLLDPANTFAPLSWKMIVVSLGSVIPGLPAAIRHRLLGWISGGARSDDSVPKGRLIAAAMRDFHAAQPMPARPTEAELLGISVPVLAIIAGRSIVHDAERAAATARRIPGAQVELWPAASHAVNGEFPDRIARRFRDFARA
ncbi:alpha/beta fold hydrolase [Nocardia blacklockiae]|uniref:alpha/beta fold hydrolase n=1 Tax=Nocardia blacklockiae TaxID=480036 RepID=UPI0018937088|nr:alpha/beta hydrolase [Nocardia blacklockiae]MBF6176704.1 alpha/beta fold hydrolase [Nocardia blacklockiae]